MIDWLWIPAAFMATLLSDVVFTLYLLRTAQGRALSAATYSALIYVISGVLVLIYVDKGLPAVVPVAAGAWVGTWLTIRWDRRKSVTKNPHNS